MPYYKTTSYDDPGHALTVIGEYTVQLVAIDCDDPKNIYPTQGWRELNRDLFSARRCLLDMGYGDISTKRGYYTDYLEITALKGDSEASGSFYCTPNLRSRVESHIKRWDFPENPPLSERMLSEWINDCAYLTRRMIEGETLDEHDEYYYSLLVRNCMEIAPNTDGMNGRIVRNQSMTRVGISTVWEGVNLDVQCSLDPPPDTSREDFVKAVTGMMIGISRTARQTLIQERETA